MYVRQRSSAAIADAVPHWSGFTMPPTPIARRPAVLSAVLFTALLITGCNENQAAEQPPAPTPPAVGAVEVAPRDVPLSLEYAARTAGTREVEVRARARGNLRERTSVGGAQIGS